MDPKAFKKMALNLLDEIDNHANALIFSSHLSSSGGGGSGSGGVVNPAEYGQVVYKAEDLETIKAKVSADPIEIRNYNELQRDVARIFLNAIMFNRSDAVVRISQSLSRVFPNI